jgi:hypothetical protein
MVVKATFEPAGAVAGLWVPCFVFGHLFAGVFLWRVLCMVHPRLVKSIKKKLFRQRAADGKTGGASGKSSSRSLQQCSSQSIPAGASTT